MSPRALIIITDKSCRSLSAKEPLVIGLFYKTFFCVSSRSVTTNYRVANMHRMPYLYRSFPQKSPIRNGSFAERDLQPKPSYASSQPAIAYSRSPVSYQKSPNSYQESPNPYQKSLNRYQKSPIVRALATTCCSSRACSSLPSLSPPLPPHVFVTGSIQIRSG